MNSQAGISDQNMMIGNKNVPVRTEEVDIFELDYYPQNPRINYILSKHGELLGSK